MEKVALQKINLKSQSQNLRTDYIQNEYQNLLYYIDNDIEHQKLLAKGVDLLDRYSDIKPYEHNRININNYENYINASPINILSPKYFIAAQGPKDETIEDFWRMIDEQNCNIIVMLCNLMEDGRPKCAEYWNIKNQMKSYVIKNVKEEIKNQYIIRDITFINERKKEKNVKQIHFTGWPDNGVPNIQDGTVFEIFCEMIKKVDIYKGNDPIVVHCSAGVGRTGTFISMYYLEKEIKKQIEDKVDIIQFSIFNLVRKLKEMRLYLVQNYDQYLFIYQFVYYLLNKYNI